eukprot:GHUV01018704.1.p1 GENE.GHUV01018704.1~~GHUV01018704.1.p1  ORF type:complete len:176 (+),score=49.67 GHUV01018704.1:556-1083(+)
MDAGGSWQASVMEHLAPTQGWAPLRYYAQLSVERLRQQHLDPTAAKLPCPTALDWQEIQLAAERALAKGHAALLEGQPTAHGDARLINVLGKQQGDHNWAIRFVDFDWSGIEGTSRYPATISAHVAWPAGVRTRGPLRQEHDKQLLQAELTWLVADLEAQAKAEDVQAGKKVRTA